MANNLIVIAEDDPWSAELLADVLEHHGYRVVHVTNGRDCLAAVAAETPALVLMDIHMPGMGGVDALQALRALPAMQQLKVIALTASVMRHEVASFKGVGFDGFHPKPVDIEGLLREIAALLHPTEA